MKRIGFITTNKVLAQSLAAAVKSNPALGFEPFLLLDPGQAALDAEILGLDAAVVDTGGAGNTEAFCGALRQRAPGCRLLLLVPQGGGAGRRTAIKAVRCGAADDFVFCDTSLDYLFAKLAAM